ncbi:MAG: hypothetical protein M3R24_23700 [Chloroflexota bacterium]|nr:hypothetical protein [Chloroflexota bacterium]
MEPHDAEHLTGPPVLTSDRDATSHATTVPPGWEAVTDIHLPRPTYWPAVLALGITFLAWGVVTSLLIVVVGILLLVLAVGGWIGDLLHEH